MLHNLLVFLLDGQDENVPKNAEWYSLNFILCISDEFHKEKL
jgi:hypothetical protein